jgi:hypothetical protein
VYSDGDDIHFRGGRTSRPKFVPNGETSMSTRRVDPSRIWDDASGDPPPMTLKEFNARVDASNDRLEAGAVDAQARVGELEELLQRKEALVSRLSTLLEESRREWELIDSRIAALTGARPRARRASRRAATVVCETPAAQ